MAIDGTDPTGWPARNSQIALVAGRQYELCFYHRDAGTARTTWQGKVRVASYNGTSWTDSLSATAFNPGTSYGQSCMTFTAADGQSVLQFGVIDGSTPGSYLVDDLTIEDTTP